MDIIRVNRGRLTIFKNALEAEWLNNIAPFWLKYAPDELHGGFRGWITNDLEFDENAEKGIILHSRILWTFSRAYKLYKDEQYLQMANCAFAYILDHFLDPVAGGVFWTVDYLGQPSDTKKRTYAQGFALYSFTEYYQVTGSKEALSTAFEMFYLIERSCRDSENDGYLETFERDWTPAANQRLSEADQDDNKSMNAHLHVLEAYTSFAHVTGDGRALERLRAVLLLFQERIVHPNGTHLQMFFDEQWNSRSEVRSFGHDIEASWLLCKAADVLGDHHLISDVRRAAIMLTASVYDEGLDTDGSLLYEADHNGVIDREKHWWVQAEAVVGFVNTWQITGDDRYFTAAERVWSFINRYVIDHQDGEWFWKTSETGIPSDEMPKVSQWKCPYHNGRMCFEISERLNNIEEISADESH